MAAKLVYLAGPIDLVDQSESHGWREKAANKLVKKGFGVFSPAHAFEISPGDVTPDIAAAILSINAGAVEECDAILCNLSGPGYGTPIEFAAFLAAGKICAAFNGNTNSLYVKVWPHYETMGAAIRALVEGYAERD